MFRQLITDVWYQVAVFGCDAEFFKGKLLLLACFRQHGINCGCTFRRRLAVFVLEVAQILTMLERP